MCGANGASKIKNSRNTETGFVSHVIASFTKTIIAEMAVLKRIPSRSSVTFLMQACSVLSCAGVGGVSLIAGLSLISSSNSLRFSAFSAVVSRLFEFRLARFIREQPPDAAEKTINTLDAFGVPRFHHFERPHEHFVKTERVRAELLENVIGIHHVAARLGHLLAVFAQNQALIDELEEWFRRRDVAEIEQNLVPEPGVKQMKNGVFGAADV